MFKDIRVFLDDERTDYTYEMKNGEIVCTVNIEDNYDNLDIVYDENIYENITFVEDTEVEELSAGKIRIKNVSNPISFRVEVNYKYFVKTSYKYINNLIDDNCVLEELNIFKNTNVGKKCKDKLDIIINDFKEKLSKKTDENKDELEDVLLNSELHTTLAEKMNTKDIMLLITYYISCKRLPVIDQKVFNELVISAINYDHALENVWRLGMNYDRRGFNYDLLDEFFVNSKDSWYLSEYITGVSQVDKEKIVNMIIDTNDKVFIKKLLEDNFIQNYLDEEYIKLLENTLNI